MAEISEKMRKKMAKRKEEMRKGQGGNFPYFVVKEGTTRFRHLPVGEDNEPGIEVVTFYLGKELGTLISPATFGEPCALMEKYNKLSKSSKEGDIQLAKTLKPKPKVMIPSLRYNDDKGKELDEGNGPKLLMTTKGLYADAIDLYLEPEQGDFTDPKEGYDIKYSREGKTLTDTEYTCIPCKPTELPKAYRKKIFDPEEMVKSILPSYDDTKEKLKAFLAGLSDGDEGDDKDEAPKKKSKDKAPKKKKKKSKL